MITNKKIIIKNILMISGAVLLLSACGSDNTTNTPTQIIDDNNSSDDDSSTNTDDGGETNNPDPLVIIPEPKECLSGNASLIGKVVSISGTPIPNVDITINGCNTKSNGEGIYTFYNIVKKDNSFITMKSDTHLSTSISIKIEDFYQDTTDISKNYITTILSKYSVKDAYSSKIEKKDNFIDLSFDSYYYADGYQYNGEVSLYSSYNNVNTKEYRRNFPGKFEGIDSNGVDAFFESFGLISVDLKDSDGKNIYVNSEIKLSFPSVEGLIENSIALWKFDFYTGIWTQKGTAEKQADGKYVAYVNQVGTWSISRPFNQELGLYRGRIVFGGEDDNPELGLPVKDVRVYLTGKNWRQASLTSNGDGVFEIPVKADESLGIHAYTYRDDYIAEYVGDPLPPVAAGEVFDDRM